MAVLSSAGLAYAVLSSAVVPALPTIQHSLPASETGVTWLLTGYLLSASVGTAILGRLGDMYGKERVLLWTLVILAGGTLLGAVSHSLELLIAARVIQGVAGGIFPLAFGIVRDEFPREKVAGSIGFLSAGLGNVAGVAVCAAWIGVETRSREPLIDMAMMRIRGVWTTNLTAFLLGAGMYASFIVFPQFAQLPTSTGFGYGASVVMSGVYLLPSTLGMVVVGLSAGWIARRFGSKPAVIAGSAVTAGSFGLITAAHAHPYEMLISTALLGIG